MGLVLISPWLEIHGLQEFPHVCVLSVYGCLVRFVQVNKEESTLYRQNVNLLLADVFSFWVCRKRFNSLVRIMS
jgi:hypothetical protein